jgi:KUP system potassium uptake protein
MQIIRAPMVLQAVNPHYAFEFLIQNGWKGYALLGGVFLVMTGGEALYADLGHFGKRPIRFSWFTVALPALLLNYFGQAAYLYQHPTAINNPFYLLAPSQYTMPLVILATIATVIASQAVITATFSLTKQAVLLGLYPHLPIIQTSKEQRGQIYIPQMNYILGIGSLLLVLTFKSSNALTHAYGMAVNFVMLLVTLMIAYTAHRVWKWHWSLVIAIFPIFLVVDILFLGANLEKLITGGWVPILFATICAFIMFTWNQGMNYLRTAYYTKKTSVPKILEQLDNKNLKQLPGATAIFITDVYDQSGGSFLQFLKLSNAIPEHILLLSYHVRHVPYVHLHERFQIKILNNRACHLILHYGFMDYISVPEALDECVANKLLPFVFEVEKITYFVEIPNILASPSKKTLWFEGQEKLFAFLMRNYSSNLNIDFYQLPYDRTVAIGTYFVM